MTTMVSNLELIRRVPLFSVLTASQAASVADTVVKRRFKRGEPIVEQGKKSNALSIILTGRARVTTDSVAAVIWPPCIRATMAVGWAIVASPRSAAVPGWFGACPGPP